MICLTSASFKVTFEENKTKSPQKASHSFRYALLVSRTSKNYALAMLDQVPNLLHAERVQQGTMTQHWG